MMKWDRLFVLLEWKRVIHDILIASQKQVVDAEVSYHRLLSFGF
jgi:hypothetical protein